MTKGNEGPQRKPDLPLFACTFALACALVFVLAALWFEAAETALKSVEEPIVSASLKKRGREGVD
jgi:hypothetical protein